VAYALPEKQYLQRVKLEEGATVEQAIIASGLLALRDDIDLAKNKWGSTVVRLSCMIGPRWRPGKSIAR
jgi:putative ubiquitin-RnfH superfamily antitoxin RatB of RatAB toxin-antitoxin module